MLVSQEQTERRLKQLACFSWVSLPLFEVMAHFGNHETVQLGPDSA
jgi:hypothetical protein